MDMKLSWKMLAIPLAFLKVSYLYTIPCGFYGYPNEQSWMCELCIFSQILSHIRTEPNYHYTYSSDVLYLTTEFKKNSLQSLFSGVTQQKLNAQSILLLN